MPISPAELFRAAGVLYSGAVPWGTRPPVSDSGIYAVSLSSNRDAADVVHANAPIAVSAVRTWLGRVPGLQLDGNPEPTAEDVAACLSTFWLPDESIVYIGKATKLNNRLGQFFNHKLGERRPHAGGHWLKALSVLNKCTIHYGKCGDPETFESKALDAFVDQASAETKSTIANSGLPIPFANRAHPQGNRKQTRIGKDTV